MAPKRKAAEDTEDNGTGPGPPFKKSTENASNGGNKGIPNQDLYSFYVMKKRAIDQTLRVASGHDSTDSSGGRSVDSVADTPVA